ncbi:Mu transposase C-terminal domain-containing protein [Pseudomonas sp. CBC3]|uniref:Mu transposase C-terminal domain-containing protein n=1 Tax=Pseudomonas sp. CBC3 TaxID=3123318 RepID=UPI0030E9AE01
MAFYSEEGHEVVAKNQAPAVKPSEAPLPAAELSNSSSTHSIDRYNIATERIPFIKQFLTGGLAAKEAAKMIGVKLSGFYKIIRRVQASGGDLSAVVAGKPGRRNTPLEFSAEVEEIIAEAVKSYRGKAATIESVWKKSHVLADERGLPRPSYHVVRRRLRSRGKKFLEQMRLGKAEAADTFEARPGYKVTTRPLEWVQIDHTRVDLIIVDEDDRTVVDRPWVSFAICIHTRAIVGFYLSLLPPNGVTVALLIENCVLSKRNLLASYGLDESLWPMFGIPEVLHADNAAEFRSEIIKANLKRFGVKIEHRDVGKKHQGGHIERLIGTMMNSHIHFLRGTTYSNTIERGDEDSEGRACFTISELRKYFLCAIHAYNDRKHSSIGMSPLNKWKEHFARHAPPRQIEDGLQKNFRYVLYPEKLKTIRNCGIEMNGRFYYAPCLQEKIRTELTVKYDPNDLSYLLVDLDKDGKYEKIPVYRNETGRSNDYAEYRVERQCKGERAGTNSPEGTASLALCDQIAADAQRKTSQSKRQAAKQAGKKDQKQYTESLDAQADSNNQDGTVLVGDFAKETTNTKSEKPAKPVRGKANQPKTDRRSVVNLTVVKGTRDPSKQAWRGFAAKSSAVNIDYDVAPTIY